MATYSYLEKNFLNQLNAATKEFKGPRQNNTSVLRARSKEGKLGDLLRYVLPVRKRPAADALPGTPPPSRHLLPPSLRFVSIRS